MACALFKLFFKDNRVKVSCIREVGISSGNWAADHYCLFQTLKESLHIILVAIFYCKINRISSLKDGLMIVEKSRKENNFKELIWGLIKDNHN